MSKKLTCQCVGAAGLFPWLFAPKPTSNLYALFPFSQEKKNGCTRARCCVLLRAVVLRSKTHTILRPRVVWHAHPAFPSCFVSQEGGAGCSGGVLCARTAPSCRLLCLAPRLSCLACLPLHGQTKKSPRDNGWFGLQCAGAHNATNTKQEGVRLSFHALSPH